MRSSVVCHGRIHGANGRGSVIGHSCSCSPGPACSVLCLVGDSSVLFMLVHSSCDTDRSCSTACRARASAQAGLSPTSLGSAQRANVQRRWTNERRRTVPRTRRTRTMGSGPDRRCQARSQAISIHFCIFERSVTQLTASRSATPCATPHPQPQDYLQVRVRSGVQHTDSDTPRHTWVAAGLTRPHTPHICMDATGLERAVGNQGRLIETRRSALASAPVLRAPCA